MTEADISAAAYVRKAALDRLAAETNVQLDPWLPRQPAHLRHLLRTDPECSWVAEMNGIVVGFAMGFVRGRIWFLSQLFVQPEVHNSGAGIGVLERSIDGGRARGAEILSVVASPATPAHALYMRAGMFTVAVGYAMHGPVDALLSLPAPGAHQKRIVDCSGWQERIAELDRMVWGGERRADHEFYLSPGSYPEESASLGLSEDGRFAGYAYVSESGWIGPLAADEPARALMLLRMTGEWLHERGTSHGRMYVLSSNPTVLGALLRLGWRLDRRTYFMTSQPFGQFDRYVPASGAML